MEEMETTAASLMTVRIALYLFQQFFIMGTSELKRNTKIHLHVDQAVAGGGGGLWEREVRWAAEAVVGPAGALGQQHRRPGLSHSPLLPSCS